MWWRRAARRLDVARAPTSRASHGARHTTHWRRLSVEISSFLVVVAARVLHEAVRLGVAKIEIAVVCVYAASRVFAGVHAGASSAAARYLIVCEAY